MFFSGKPDLSNLKVSGCTAFKHIETHQDKFSNKATKEIFVGYSKDSEAYILYNPYSKMTSFSRCAPKSKHPSICNRKAGTETSFA